MTLHQPLPQLRCPRCQNDLGTGVATKVAKRYSDCVRFCEPCGIGFSNARVSPTTIFRVVTDNVPEQVREGVVETLRAALNECNRPNKMVRFGFSTSEDALTWTVFTFLAKSGQLSEALRAIDAIEGTTAPAVLLLWGVPYPLQSSRGTQIRQQLSHICRALGERPDSTSEPDVIVDLGDAGLVFIEVKYRSRNDRRAAGSVYSRYMSSTDAFKDGNKVLQSELYELARNWRIGTELAGRRSFTLVNLVAIFDSVDRSRVQQFTAGIATGHDRRFRVVNWNRLTSAFDRPGWLEQYLEERFGKTSHSS